MQRHSLPEIHDTDANTEILLVSGLYGVLLLQVVLRVPNNVSTTVLPLDTP